MGSNVDTAAQGLPGSLLARSFQALTVMAIRVGRENLRIRKELRTQQEEVRTQQEALGYAAEALYAQERAFHEQEEALRDQEQALRDQEEAFHTQEEASAAQEVAWRAQEKALRAKEEEYQNLIHAYHGQRTDHDESLSEREETVLRQEQELKAKEDELTEKEIEQEKAFKTREADLNTRTRDHDNNYAAFEQERTNQEQNMRKRESNVRKRNEDPANLERARKAEHQAKENAFAEAKKKMALDHARQQEAICLIEKTVKKIVERGNSVFESDSAQQDPVDELSLTEDEAYHVESLDELLRAQEALMASKDTVQQEDSPDQVDVVEEEETAAVRNFLRFVESYSTLDVEKLVAHLAPSFIHVVRPSSIGMPSRKLDDFMLHAWRMFSLFETFTMTPHTELSITGTDYHRTIPSLFYCRSKRAVISYCTMDGKLNPVSPKAKQMIDKGIEEWKNECILIAKFNEDGKIEELVEVVDSHKAHELKVRLGGQLGN